MNDTCKHCNHTLIWRSHKKITPKILKQAYYFSEWQYCENCKTVWLHEDRKVFNKSDIGRYVRNLEEESEQTSFFNGL